MIINGFINKIKDHKNGFINKIYDHKNGFITCKHKKHAL